MSSKKIEVGIIMGSDSDLPIMEDAVKLLSFTTEKCKLVGTATETAAGFFCSTVLM